LLDFYPQEVLEGTRKQNATKFSGGSLVHGQLLVSSAPLSVISNLHRVSLQIDAAVVAAIVCRQAAHNSGQVHGGASCSRLFPLLLCLPQLGDRKSLGF
jgi:hypothetical protein